MANVQTHIGAKPIGDDDTGPQFMIGFTSEHFSQCVFLDVPADPKDAVIMADAFYKGILEACSVAHKEWNSNKDGDAPKDGTA